MISKKFLIMTVANLMQINWDLALVLKEVFVKRYGDVNIQFGLRGEGKKTKAACVLVLLILWNCHCLMFHEFS